MALEYSIYCSKLNKAMLDNWLEKNINITSVRQINNKSIELITSDKWEFQITVIPNFQNNIYYNKGADEREEMFQSESSISIRVNKAKDHTKNMENLVSLFGFVVDHLQFVLTVSNGSDILFIWKNNRLVLNHSDFWENSLPKLFTKEYTIEKLVY